MTLARQRKFGEIGRRQRHAALFPPTHQKHRRHFDQREKTPNTPKAALSFRPKGENSLPSSPQHTQSGNVISSKGRKQDLPSFLFSNELLRHWYRKEKTHRRLLPNNPPSSFRPKRENLSSFRPKGENIKF